MGDVCRLKTIGIPVTLLLLALGGGGCLSGGGSGGIEEAGTEGTAPEAYEIRIRFPESIVDEVSGGMSALKSSHDSGKGKSKDDDKDKKEVVCKKNSVQVECTVSLFNTGVDEPLFTTLVRFCNCFDCDPDVFAGNLATGGKGRNPAGGRLEVACVTDKKLFTGKTGDGFFCENEDKKDGHGIVDFCQLSVDMFHSGCDDLEDFGRFVCLSKNPLPTQIDLYEVLISKPREFLGCPDVELCGNAHCDIVTKKICPGTGLDCEEVNCEVFSCEEVITYDDREVCPGDCATLGDGECTCENTNIPDENLNRPDPRAYFDCHCGDLDEDPSVGENVVSCRKDCGYCGDGICTLGIEESLGESEESCIWDCAGVERIEVGEVRTPFKTAATVDCPPYALPCTEDSKCQEWWELGPEYTCDEVTVHNPLFRFLDKKASCCTRNRLCNIGLRPTEEQVDFEGPPCGTDADCAEIKSTFPTVDSSGNRVGPGGQPFTYDVSWICDRSRCVCVEPREIGCFCNFDGRCDHNLGERASGGGEGGFGEFKGCPDCRGRETNCSDGTDNDRDGFTDCDDPDCSSNIACGGGGVRCPVLPFIPNPRNIFDSNGDGGVSCAELTNARCPFDCAACCDSIGRYSTDGTCCLP
jgi:hypothetical protein